MASPPTLVHQLGSQRTQSRSHLRYAKCERKKRREVKRHGRKSSSSIRKRNTENAHREREEYWNASRRRRDENIGDVETPVAKQFFDRIRARTCVELGLSLFLRFLSFFEPDMEHRKWTAIFPFNGARVFSCNAAPLQDGLNLTPPPSTLLRLVLRIITGTNG